MIGAYLPFFKKRLLSLTYLNPRTDPKAKAVLRLLRLALVSLSLLSLEDLSGLHGYMVNNHTAVVATTCRASPVRHAWGSTLAHDKCPRLKGVVRPPIGGVRPGAPHSVDHEGNIANLA